MDSKLREKIAEALAVQGVTDGYICDKTKAIADSILALLVPELEAAEKWRKVSSLVEGDCNSCKSLRYCEKNDIHPCEILKDALEGEGEKG